MPQQSELTEKLSRVEELIGKLENSGDPATRALAKELVQLLLEVHASGLERMMEITFQSGGTGMDIIDRFGQDEMSRSLLLLHGLHPQGLEARVAEGLESILGWVAAVTETESPSHPRPDVIQTM